MDTAPTHDVGEPDYLEILQRMFYGYKHEFEVEEYDIELRRQRHIYTMNGAFGSFFQSPVGNLLKEGCQVLDVGCGIGIWMLTMAKLYPASTFIGLDINPLYPSKNLPRNATFMQHNVISGLPFADSTFDFVHIDYVISGMLHSEWDQVFEEIRRVLKPGGWLDCTEFNMVLYPSYPVPELHKKSMGMFEAGGLDIQACDSLSKIFESMDRMRLDKSVRMLYPLYNRGTSWLLDKHSDCIDLFAEQLRPIILSTTGWTEDIFEEHLADLREQGKDFSVVCYKFSVQKLGNGKETSMASAHAPTYKTTW